MLAAAAMKAGFHGGSLGYSAYDVAFPFRYQDGGRTKPSSRQYRQAWKRSEKPFSLETNFKVKRYRSFSGCLLSMIGLNPTIEISTAGPSFGPHLMTCQSMPPGCPGHSG